MLIEEIKEKAKTKKVIVYSDMDGVLAEYGVGEKPLILANEKDFYLNKRKISCAVEKFRMLSEIENVEIGIMSNCYFQEQKQDKLLWLEKHCPFIKKENINIIVLNDEPHTKETKDYLKISRLLSINYDKDVDFYLIEDNHNIIGATNKTRPNTGRHFSEILD